MTFDALAIQGFLNDRMVSTHPTGRLMIQNNQLSYVDKAQIGFWTRFKAKFFGKGDASMKKIAIFIENNRDALFADVNEKNDFNFFITATYNPGRTFNFKRARTISALVNEGKSLSSTIHPSSTTQSLPKPDKPKPKPDKVKPPKPAKPNAPIDPSAYGDASKILGQVLKECQDQFNALDPNSDQQVKDLASQLVILEDCIKGWEMSSKTTNKAQYQLDKQLLNDILNFKNELRAACFDKGDKALKGGYAAETKLLKKDDQELLKAPLKNVRKIALEKYFSVRLEMDGKKLAELQLRFIENQHKGVFTPEINAFLEKHLEHLQHKHDSGKPIAIPKWYHCTKTDDAFNKILNSYILYMHLGAFPGSFVANLPEFGTYGNFCFMLSDHIEKTATRNPGSKKIVHPIPSQMNKKFDGQITFSDTPIAPQDTTFKNHQDGLGIWLGFQRGEATLDPITKWGTDGIPLQCSARVNQVKPLKYYKDTSLAAVTYRKVNFGWNDDHNANEKAAMKYAKAARVQYMSFEQEEALRALVNATFTCVLPKSWEGHVR